MRAGHSLPQWRHDTVADTVVDQLDEALPARSRARRPLPAARRAPPGVASALDTRIRVEATGSAAGEQELELEGGVGLDGHEPADAGRRHPEVGEGELQRAHHLALGRREADLEGDRDPLGHPVERQVAGDVGRDRLARLGAARGASPAPC